MKILIALLFTTLAVGAYAQCVCNTMKWATCDGTPCLCTLLVGDNEKQNLNCSTLIPKCFLMKAESYRARKGLSTRSGGKPVETAIVDNDGLYDPDCENDGRFKAKQCNNTDQCWCVNSAGVRRTDKGGKDIKCEKLVETYWVRLELKHVQMATNPSPSALKGAIATAIESRYNVDPTLVKDVEYDSSANLIMVDVKKPMGDRRTDLSQMAYYMEKDVKVLPLFQNQANFTPIVNGEPVIMENILVYYVDEEGPTFTMQRLTGGIIAVIVVVALAVVAGLLVLFFARRREQKKYSKAEPRELENL